MSPIWPVKRLGYAERVVLRQAKPDDDVAVVLLQDQQGRVHYYPFQFDEETFQYGALKRARAFVAKKQAEGWRFLEGHFGYISEKRDDYTRTSDWAMEVEPVSEFGN